LAGATLQLFSTLSAQVGATQGLLDTGTPSLELPAAGVAAYMQAVQVAVAASPQLTINSVSQSSQMADILHPAN
jgi:hypothetical protein